MSRKIILTTLGIVLFFFCIAPIIQAQTTGSVSGVVKDETGSPMDATKVTVQQEGSVNAWETYTDNKGRYMFPNLSPGKYKFTIEAEGYLPINRTNITVRLGSKVSLDFTVRQTMEVSEEVLVTAPNPPVETTKVAVDQNISFEQFKEIPAQGRDFNSIINTFAGVNKFNSNFNVLGSRDNQNNFLIDGMKNNELGDSTSFGTGGYARSLYGYSPTNPSQEAEEYVQSLPGAALQQLNLDSIEEVQVSTTGYSAEYGQGSGAVFNVITRSGSDSFKVGLTLNHQTHKVNDWFMSEEDKSPYPMKRWQESLFLSGPIIEGKLRFFVSYERDDHYVGFDDRTFSEAQLNLWVADLDIWQSQQGMNRITGKFTYIESEKSKFNLTINYNDDSSSFNYTLYKAPGDIDQREGTNGGISFLLNNQRQFENGLLNLSAKYSHVNRFTDRLAGRDNLELRPQGGYDFGVGWIRRWGGYGNDVDIKIDSLQLKGTYNLFLVDKAGDHNILFGIDYENYKQHSIVDPFNYVAFWNQNTDGYTTPDNPEPWYLWFTQTSGNADYKLPLSQAALFVNEEWRMTPTLTFTGGMRLDWDEFISKTFFSPRIGLAWDPFGTGKTVIRAGGGVFRDRSDLLGYAKREYEPTFTRYYTNAGPFRGDPADLAGWEDYLNDATSSSQASSNYYVNEDLQPPMTWAANIGVERDLIIGFVFRINYIYKKMDKLFYEERERLHHLRKWSLVEAGSYKRDHIRPQQFRKYDGLRLGVRFDEEFQRRFLFQPQLCL